MDVPYRLFEPDLTNYEQKLWSFVVEYDSSGQILKFFSAFILMTRLKFSDSHELWATKINFYYINSPNFSRFMVRSRFEALRLNIIFRVQPSERSCMYAEGWRWRLWEDFLNAINRHHRTFVSPSDLLCIYKSISRWYGLWICWIDVWLVVQQRPWRE